MTNKKKVRMMVLEDLVKRGRAGELCGNLIITSIGTFRRGIFSSDFDIPVYGKDNRMDIREQLTEITKFLPTAEKVELFLVGNMEQGNTIRIRMKIIYIWEDNK